MSEISELKKTCEEKKGVPTSADTRLIIPYTSYLWHGLEWQKPEVKKKIGFYLDRLEELWENGC